MSEQHSGVLLGVAAILVVAGGTFKALGATEASQVHGMWTNPWFDSGLALVVLALAIGIWTYVVDRRGKSPTPRVSGDPVIATSAKPPERTFTDASANDLVELFQ